MPMSHHKMTKRLKEKRHKRLSSTWLRSLSSGKYSIFNKCGIFGVDKIAILKCLEWLCRILLCLMRAINIFKCIDVYTFMLSPTYNECKTSSKNYYLYRSIFVFFSIYMALHIFFPLLSVISFFFFFNLHFLFICSFHFTHHVVCCQFFAWFVYRCLRFFVSLFWIFSNFVSYFFFVREPTMALHIAYKSILSHILSQ